MPDSETTFATLKTKQHNFATSILNFINNTRKTAKEKRTAGYLRGRLAIINSYWEKFVGVHEQIISYASDEETITDSYFTDDTYSTIEIEYGEALGFLNDELAIREMPKKLDIADIDADGAHSSTRVEQNVVQIQRQHVVLPRIDVPKFNGDYTEWQAFKDLFSAIIGNNESLSNVQRLHYLKCGLTGEPARLLCNTATTDANFEVAWNVLMDRYENKRILVNTHLQTLFRLQPMTKESSTELKELLFTTNQTITALKNLNRPVDAWDDWLVHNTVQKLDKMSRRDWESKIGDSSEVSTYEELCSFLSARIRTLEAIDTTKTVTTSQKPKNTINAHQSSSIKCRECNKNHSLVSCAKFRNKPVDERRLFVKNENICFNCLSDRHLVSDCTSKFGCKRCDKKHHTLVHLDFSSLPSNSNQPIDSTRQLTSVSSNMAKKESGYGVLLATAVVMVQDRNRQLVPLRALLDQGSQSSFVSEEAVQILKLQKV